jgi:hypothetical protein
MPVFRYSCACGWCGELLVTRADDPAKCPDGHTADRMFSPTTNLKLAPWMTREAEDGRARHRHWLEKPETQARIRSGELDTDMSDKYCQSGDDVGNSSSIADRAAEGLAF